MKLFVDYPEYRYELENIARTFLYGDVEIVESAGIKRERNDSADYAYFRISRTKPQIRLLFVVSYRGVKTARMQKLPSGAEKPEIERTLAAMLFDCLVSLTGKKPEWGIITGVRPAKFVQSLMDGGLSEERTVSRLREVYRVSKDKALLAVKTAGVSKRIATYNTEKSYSLYVSIPFCPSRCEYCSFVSKTIERERHLLAPYLEKLILELEETARVAGKLNLRLETIYIGGGTPTVYSAEELRTLCAAVKRLFPVKTAREYTVEAGRPDTISLDKLAVLREYGVTRISINPQTFNDDVLRLIGRKHTADDIVRAFGEARETGFTDINADLIAGLRGDTLTGFQESVKKLLALSPEEITIHALTLKRASFLTERSKLCSTLLPSSMATRDSVARFRKKEQFFSDGVSEMVSFSYKELKKNNYLPYYMYKQKGTVDSLENVGYAKPGQEGLYNIFIMDELHSILSCGAGGVTKLKNQKTDKIERIFNYKYPQEYIDGFATILARKKGIERFYEGDV